MSGQLKLGTCFSCFNLAQRLNALPLSMLPTPWPISSRQSLLVRAPLNKRRITADWVIIGQILEKAGVSLGFKIQIALTAGWALLCIPLVVRFMPGPQRDQVYKTGVQ